MKAYQIEYGKQLDGLYLTIKPEPKKLKPDEVRVKINMVALNYRDLMVADGTYPVDFTGSRVPTSDMAGEVIEVGDEVTKWQAGDRVMAAFFPNWQDGDLQLEKLTRNFGVVEDGMLQQQRVFRQTDLVKMPDAISDQEAAALPCSGVTAWNALFETGQLSPGSRVLIQGSGGVSMMALHLAKAAGHQVVLLTSKAQQTEALKAMGADWVIDYTQQPDWQEEVRRVTANRGVNLVVDVGGKDTITPSVESLTTGGKVVVIGGLSGFTGQLDPIRLMLGAKQALGVMVGSRQMLEKLADFVSQHPVTELVDQVFPFDKAPEAFAYFQSGQHIGKVLIQVSE